MGKAAILRQRHRRLGRFRYPSSHRVRLALGLGTKAIHGMNRPGIMVDVARSIAYAADLLAVQHVALGSDFDGATTVHFDTSELAALTQALLDEGLRDDDIRAVTGGNQVRFFLRYLPAPAD